MDWPCLDQAATQIDLADLVGVSQQAISKLYARQILVRGESLRKSLLRLCAHQREQAAGRGGGAQLQEQLVRARIRESEAKAQKVEVETAETLRELVAIRDLEPALRDWASRGQQAIDAAIGRIVDMIESEFSIELDDRHVREHLHGALRDIAAYPALHGDPTDPRGERMDAARTGTDG